MDPEEERKKIERDILEMIEERLKNGQLNAERTRQIAKLVLEKLGHHLEMEQLYEIVPRLADQFTELAGAILPLIQKHDDELRQTVNSKVHELIVKGNIDEADSVLRNALHKEEKH